MNTQLAILFMQIIMVICLSVIGLLLVLPVISAMSNNKAPVTARHVLEITDSSAAKQRMTIGCAISLLEQNATAIIEVVAVGKGVNLLFDNTPHKQAIQSLLNKGVVFTLCQQSLLQLSEKIGRSIETIPGVKMTQDGRSYADNLKDLGYIDELA